MNIALGTKHEVRRLNDLKLLGYLTTGFRLGMQDFIMQVVEPLKPNNMNVRLLAKTVTLRPEASFLGGRAIPTLLLVRGKQAWLRHIEGFRAMR